MSAPSEAARPVDIADVERIVDVGGPVLSPNGKTVAFESGGRIFVMPVTGGDLRAVTPEESEASAPQWSADGRYLYCLSDASGAQQVWRYSLASNDAAEQLTNFDEAPDDLLLSSDETRLLVSRRSPHAGADTEGVTTPWVIDRLQFKEDEGDGYITGDQPAHYFVHALDGGGEQAVTSGSYSNDEAAWSPDGNAIVVASNREAEPDATYRVDLWRQDLSAEGVAAGPLRLTDDEEPKFSPAWSPDGRWIAFISAVDGVYGVQELSIVPAAGGPVRRLTRSLDRWVSDFRFSKDGRSILFLFDQEGAVHLGRVDIESGRIETVVGGDFVVSAFDSDANGNIVLAGHGRNDADELYRVRRGKLQRLTGINDAFLAEINRGDKRKLTFAIEGGGKADTFVTLPPGYRKGQRYPAVLRIHGGPVGQFAWGYEFPAQFFAAAGYVVIEPNPRGSTGRGQDFINAIHSRWGDPDYDDLMRAVDAAIEAGLADPERLAVTGYSYGGFMTNIVITKTDRFRAAASGAGHSLIYANYGHDIYQRWYNWELGPPWENPEAYASLSPLLAVANVRTPTIFLGGRIDWNVPVLNAELFYQSLKQRGIPTRLVVYPDAHHGGWPTEFTVDYLTRVREWFGRYVLGNDPS